MAVYVMIRGDLWNIDFIGRAYGDRLCDEFLDTLYILHIDGDGDGAATMKLSDLSGYGGNGRLMYID